MIFKFIDSLSGSLNSKAVMLTGLVNFTRLICRTVISYGMLWYFKPWAHSEHGAQVVTVNLYRFVRIRICGVFILFLTLFLYLRNNADMSSETDNFGHSFILTQSIASIDKWSSQVSTILIVLFYVLFIYFFKFWIGSPGTMSRTAGIR